MTFILCWYSCYNLHECIDVENHGRSVSAPAGDAENLSNTDSESLAIKLFFRINFCAH